MGLPGFDGIVLEVEGAIVAASWWDMPSLEAVHQERGEELATLVFSWLNNRVLVWERELAVFPDHQGRGYGRIIRGAFLNEVAAQHDLVLVGTRMREDNTPTIVIGERLGFYRTGIRVEAVEKPGCWHEYWLCELPNNM